MRKVSFDGSLAHQLHTIMRSAAVQRYHTEHTVKQQSVGEHTYGVLWIIMLLTDGNPSVELLKEGLKHDTPEHVTGDLPSPTKHALGREFRAQLLAQEEKLMCIVGHPNAELTLRDQLILKLADNLEGALWCLRELQRGNRHILYCLDNYLAYNTDLLASLEHLDGGESYFEKAKAIHQHIIAEYLHESE